MARNDGIDRTVARNQDLGNPADVAKVQEHNEREKDSYSNQDIVPERTSLNVHFKAPINRILFILRSLRNLIVALIIPHIDLFVENTFQIRRILDHSQKLRLG